MLRVGNYSLICPAVRGAERVASRLLDRTRPSKCRSTQGIVNEVWTAVGDASVTEVPRLTADETPGRRSEPVLKYARNRLSLVCDRDQPRSNRCMHEMDSDDRAAPLITIDPQERAEVAAWASALHVSEKQVVEAVAKVGGAARAVIPYLLGASRRGGRGHPLD